LPLTVMDTTTLDEKDLELAWLQAMLDSKMVRWSEAHRWYYRPLQPGDGYMFITSPHEGPEHRYSGTPHSAFRFIRKKNATASRPRQSFEFRCLVVDTDWTSPAQLFKDDVPEAPTQEQIVQSSANAIMTGIVMDKQTFMQSMQDNDEMISEKSSSGEPKPPDSLTTPPGDATVTESGLAYKVITTGTGQKPVLESRVKVTYSGWGADGGMFLSTTHGAPDTFDVNEIPIAGLREGVQLMKEGETTHFWIPPKLAYGEDPDPPLPKGMVVFEVRLLSVHVD